ncbi:HGL151Wp [Eremothecium sinecaudum]|uniref:HGL151Wp n=1 Tax=Eremothecium sinecaudum TaxID=45286 RepID=A0A0X8HVD1_9SACH|nr:HGL151Wp [Eremothecium sinecaudum]AMD22189.1 HGL151Wp [Eremothecium sinecaudum]
MGVLVSLPVSLGASFISSFLGSCCSTAISSIFSSVSGASSSIAVRILYAVGLLINSLISWIAISANKSILWPSKTCTATGECGFFTVHRLNFALGAMHLLLCFTLLGVRSTRDPRAMLQNSYWWVKSIIYLLFVILAFYIPNGFYVVFSKYVSVPWAAQFILIGLVLLVDFAHEWAETCIRHVEEEDEHSKFWQRFLIYGTVLMYAVSFVMINIMLLMFCHNGCTMNIVAAVVNIVMIIFTTGASIYPSVQEFNPRSGLAQSSMVTMYCTYLTLSAMASEPDDRQCNPLVRSSGTRRASAILGSIFTFIAIAYTTTRAAANPAFHGGSSGAVSLNGDDELTYSGAGGSRSQIRREVLREAVQEGSLPESVLYSHPWAQSNDDFDDDVAADEEHYSTKYSYSLFHYTFFVATQWIAILLTTNITQDDVGDFIPVGRTYFYSWAKIISAWMCYILYSWTLIAPVVMPERFSYDI